MNDFITKMMVKADDLTNFQAAFVCMARFINEKGLADEFVKYVEERGDEE